MMDSRLRSRPVCTPVLIGVCMLWSGNGIARGADWYWSGTCDGYWYGTCLDDPPYQCSPEPLDRTYNNWGDEMCGPNLPFPGPTDSVYLVSNHVAADGNVVVDYVALDLNSTLGIGGNRTFTIGGGVLPNDGTITVNHQPSAWPTALSFAGNATLQGTGDIVLNTVNGTANAQLNATAGTTLTHAAGHTIRGRGQINATMINNGLVTADSGTGGATLELLTGNKINNATMSATNGGTLAIGGITVTQAPAGLITADNGVIRLDEGSAIVGGTLNTENGGTVRSTYLTTSTLTDLLNQGQFDIEARATTRVTGTTLTNTGTITVNNPPLAWPTYMSFEGNVTLDGDGDVLLNAASGSAHAQINTGEGFTLTQAAGHTIHGTGQINASLVNEGTVNADQDGKLVELLTNDKTNNATMTASNGGILAIGAVTVSQGGGGQIVADAGTVRLDNGATVVGGTLSTPNDGIVTIPYLGTATLTDVHNQARIDTNARSTMRVTGSTLTNDGTISVNTPPSSWPTSLIFDSSLTLDGTGDIRLNRRNHADLSTGAGVTIAHAAGHTIHGTGHVYASMINEGTVLADDSQNLVLDPQGAGFTNRGVVEAIPGAGLALDNASQFTQTTGQTIANGTIYVSGGALDLQGGALKGNGAVAGSVDNVAASVEPGTSIGTLTINGDYTQGSTGTLEIELGGTAAGEFDVLSVAATANLAGTLHVVPTGGFEPQPGQQFVILTASTGVLGCFDNIEPTGTFEVTCSGTTVTLAMTAVPGDIDGDGDVDLQDYHNFADCVGGPDASPAPTLPGVTPQDCLDAFDFDGDADVDLSDASSFQEGFSG